MRAFNPEMLLVASFRDPIERAFSQWSMGRKQKNVYPEFSEAIELYDDESMLDRVPPGSGRWSVHRRSMVIRGLYGAQLERGLAQFDRVEQLADAELRRVGPRLPGRASTSSPTSWGSTGSASTRPLRLNPTPERQRAPTPSEADIDRLVERYADDLSLFEKLSGLDVSQWPTRRIVRGDMAAGELAEKLVRQVRGRLATVSDAAAGPLPISFAIVGVQKAATSTMHTMLVRHRHVARGTAKELHFFDDERLDWDDPDYSHYVVPRTKGRQRIAGDATPSYIWWPRALERMHRYNPEMRLIASFRDPIERAFSQWSMERKRRHSYPSFGESIEKFGDLSLLDRVPSRPHVT